MPEKKITITTKKFLFLILFLFGAGVYSADQSRWLPLANDGLHDPENPVLQTLQNPGEALSVLPEDYTGNKVLWMKALDEGYIQPRTSFSESTTVLVLDLDIVMAKTGEMPMVRFPHKQHTEWLDCKNCHNKIFKMESGTTPVNMFAILQGEYCGRCHGAVAFPLTECLRCHSVARNQFKGNYGAQYKSKEHEKNVKLMSKKVEKL